MSYADLYCSWEDISGSYVSDNEIQEMIRIRERVILALDDPNLDIRNNPSKGLLVLDTK